MGIVKGQHYQLLINFSTEMAKVTKPSKKICESDKKPDFLTLSNTKDGLKGVVKFKRPKAKSRIIKKFN